MPFLPPNQQRQSTEGSKQQTEFPKKKNFSISAEMGPQIGRLMLLE